MVLWFNVPVTANVIWRRDLEFYSHPTDWRSQRTYSRILVYKVSIFYFAPRGRLLTTGSLMNVYWPVHAMISVHCMVEAKALLAQTLPIFLVINDLTTLQSLFYFLAVVKRLPVITHSVDQSKTMQIPGTEAVRSNIQPSKPNGIYLQLQIVKIQREHMVNRVSSSFPKGGLFSNQNRTTHNKKTHKVKCHLVI